MKSTLNTFLVGLILLGFSISSYAIDEHDIIAYWSCDEGSGEVVADAIGGYDGTLMVGSGWEGEPHNEGWGEGRFGKALAFDENKEWFVSIGTDDVLDQLGKPDTEFTVVYWLKTAKTSGKGRTVDKGSSGWTQGWHCAIVNGRAFMEVCDAQAPGAQLTGNMSVADDKWHHIAHVFKVGQTATIYVDGSADAQGNISSDPDIAGIDWGLTFGTVGEIQNPWHEFLNGFMDDIAIFDKALSEEEISGLMSGVVVSPSAVSANDKLVTTWADIRCGR